MTVQEYLQEFDETISAAPEVMHVEIIRRTVWDTGTEVVGLYRYKLSMSDGSLLELMERIVQDRQIQTFPHHLHEGSETNVASHDAITGLEVVNLVSSILANQA
ncbi:MAG: hypothetical protein GY801_43845 [bacterium]|nr:hypothetical protein [bacterium]